MDQPFEIRTARLWMGEDGIARKTIKGGAEETLADARQSVNALQQLTGGRPAPLLVDMGGLRAITRDARRYYASDEAARSTSALALVAGSPVGRVCGRFLLGLNPPLYPARLFDETGEALGWLKEFIV